MTVRGENKTRPVALDDVAKMKVGCDVYLRMKAAQDMQKAVAAKAQAMPAGET
jgi:hypothetical protein